MSKPFVSQQDIHIIFIWVQIKPLQCVSNFVLLLLHPNTQTRSKRENASKYLLQKVIMQTNTQMLSKIKIKNATKYTYVLQKAKMRSNTQMHY